MGIKYVDQVGIRSANAWNIVVTLPFVGADGGRLTDDGRGRGGTWSVTVTAVKEKYRKKEKLFGKYNISIVISSGGGLLLLFCTYSRYAADGISVQMKIRIERQ